MTSSDIKADQSVSSHLTIEFLFTGALRVRGIEVLTLGRTGVVPGGVTREESAFFG
jgi:hypothetical protein